MDGNGVHRREVEVARNNEESREPRLEVPVGPSAIALRRRCLASCSMFYLWMLKRRSDEPSWHHISVK